MSLTLADRYNRDCNCSVVDLPRLYRQLDQSLGAEVSPQLFADTPVFLDPAQVSEMQAVVEAVESIVDLPRYQRAVLDTAPAIAQPVQRARGVFLGFDFHLSPEGPKLIEINTNAGGAFLNIAARAARVSCCGAADRYLATLPDEPALEAHIFEMFLHEWRLARGDVPLHSIAIVDRRPREQFLHPEFLLARKLFAARGIGTEIVDPDDLEIRGERLHARGVPVDLVYNRLTDFYFDDGDALRTAYLRGLAVITPHPRAHALYANKGNLALMGDGELMRSLGASRDAAGVLARCIPATREVAGEAELWWRNRKDWFFKPRQGFGSRGAYRGEKLTRRVFAELMQGNYLAQRLTPPSERRRSSIHGNEIFKVDIRCYAYGGAIQLMAARLYQGQTTNFRTTGGGFAPVYVVGA
jgi:hypothetical protein